jgi:type IV pilus assembly protein PilC
MKQFVYSADVKGKIVKKNIRAASISQARNFLKKKNIDVVSISEKKDSLYEKLFTDNTVRPDDIVSFSQLFTGCIQTGLSIKDSLTILEKQVQNKRIQNAISTIITDITSGTSLSDAFANHPDIFPKYYPMTIKAGEASGNLADVLNYISDFMEKTNEIRKQIKSILTYPIAVSIIAGGLLIVIFIFVAPVFKEMFASSKSPLPLPTIILFAISDALKAYGGIIASIIGTLIITFVGFKRTKKGKKIIDTKLLTLPVIGKLNREVILLGFLGNFEVLINNNVPILHALQVLEEGISNLAIKELVQNMRRDVSKGLPMSGPLLKNKHLISPLVAHTISTGEKAGTLGPSLKRITEYMNKEIVYTMKDFSSKMDPIITVSMGCIVLYIAISIYLPIFDMMTHM